MREQGQQMHAQRHKPRPKHTHVLKHRITGESRIGNFAACMGKGQVRIGGGERACVIPTLAISASFLASPSAARCASLKAVLAFSRAWTVKGCGSTGVTGWVSWY